MAGITLILVPTSFHSIVVHPLTHSLPCFLACVRTLTTPPAAATAAHTHALPLPTADSSACSDPGAGSSSSLAAVVQAKGLPVGLCDQAPR